MERKENFVRLKLWEENRGNITHNLATVVIGMIGVLLQRIENSATENETFAQYFQNYIKIWNDHSIVIEKNAQKFLTPMR
jgi:hypothetical protein